MRSDAASVGQASHLRPLELPRLRLYLLLPRLYLGCTSPRQDLDEKASAKEETEEEDGGEEADDPNAELLERMRLLTDALQQFSAPMPASTAHSELFSQKAPRYAISPRFTSCLPPVSCWCLTRIPRMIPSWLTPRTP